MKKVILLLILSLFGIKTYAQSILLDPKKYPSTITEGIKFKYLSNDFEVAEERNVPSAVGVCYYSVNGVIYVTNFDGDKIHKIQNSQVTEFVTTGLDGPHDIVIQPGVSIIFVSNFFAGTIKSFNTSGVLLSTYSGFSNPTGMAFDYYGNVFVANYGNGTISKIAAGGSVTHNFITGLADPYGIVYDPLTNKIFISNYSADEIAQADATTGGVKSTFKSGIQYCTGIARNSFGDLIVAQAGLNKIISISQDGQVKDLTNTTYPLDVTIDASDNLYTANQTINKVTKYEPKYDIGALLGVDAFGNIKKANLEANGYKLYLKNSLNNGIYADGADFGIYGTGYSQDGSGIYGIANGVFAKGVNGRADGNYGNGVCGRANGNFGVGVYGFANGYLGYGVHGESTNIGVYATGQNNGVYAFSNGGIGIYAKSATGTAGFFDGKVQVNGNLCAFNVACPSDFTLKRDITPLRSSLQKLCNIGGYNYFWKDTTQNKRLQTGVIAQELQKILPELVNEDKDKKLSVNYIGLIPHLIEAVKELKNENELLKAKIKQYDNRLEAIETVFKQQSASLKQ